ncbi:hypothetical protein FC70_GL000354 [Paucilactobacillus oligofermentans DSM 15707 = LMG 22743]|uniref:SpoVT-AbrB domain-containing protein n=1 Tax=Paucilactobacillus oligofermentans DSM 15707 = LMG 22743 TaxID=1423778 RepID=A0A0R1RNG8_9LACO|nr:AbrB/MazE/SpoVT family DNA-binding domain-containing protein [Paucilactobacillus oligofermentans]KRL57881.1 hypothetical protein FC70_GL000354 [Paucilactobacillus oligofermentans DSM 15707 = LMG 22743]CUS26647.1 Putative transcriptional regulator [Paucilactobacillus oligofermentans DSM 15707 = LMG 22743]
MSTSTRKLSIPAEVVDKLNLKPGDPVKIVSQDNEFIVKLTNKKELALNSISILWYLPTSIVVGLIFYAVFINQKVHQIPLHGDNSIATMVIFGSVITGIIFFSIFFFLNRKRISKDGSRVYLRIYFPLVISFAVILVLGLLGLFWVIGLMFHGVSFDPFTSAIIFILFNALINYSMILAALSVSTNVMTNLLMAVIISGTVLSMLSNQNSHWWQHNLSFLGTQMADKSWQFNLSLMLSSLLMIALVDYLFVSLHATFPHSKKLLLLRTLLTVTAIDIAAVGIFPNDISFHNIHTQFAQLLVLFVLAMMISVNWLLPKTSKEFTLVSIGAGIAIAATSIGFYGIHYLSLTAFELIAFMIAFAWILILLQNITDLTQTENITVRIE